MALRSNTLVIVILALGIIIAGCAGPSSKPRATPAPTRPPTLSWDGSIGTLLNDRCASCHGQVAGISYATYESALRGGMNGPVIIPGDPANSKLVVKQSTGDHHGQLTPQELAWVKEWIRWGAPEK